MDKQIIDIENILQNWEHDVLSTLPKIIDGITVFILFFILAHLTKFICKYIFKKNHFSKLLSTSIYIFFLFSGIFLASELIGLQSALSHFLAGAGIIGIIAGFAFKDVVSNFFSGLLLKTHIPYKEEDWIEIDDKYGEVQEVSIPNQIIYTGTFTNYSLWSKRRVTIQSGVSCGDDLDFVKQVAIDEIKSMDYLLPEENIDFYFTNIGNSSFNFILRFWIKFQKDDDFLKAQDEAIIKIKKRFEKENISIPYNVISLDFGVKGGINLFDKNIKINT